MEIKDLIRCRDLSNNQVGEILQTARDMKRGTLKVPLFFGQKPQVSLVFLENSTRTKLSFQAAAMRLGVDCLDFEADKSSLAKGESVLDSFRCLEAMGIDAAIVRWKEDQLKDLQDKLSIKLISAGEGVGSHPSQALLDYMTWSEKISDFKNKTLLIAGDIAHSRVAASHLELAEIMGVNIQLAGPAHWIPVEHSSKQVDFDEALTTCDAVMMLRVQKERHERNIHTEDYNIEYGLNRERLSKLKDSACIFHPGPFNLGVEITQDVLDDPRCLIWEQVKNGLYTRMAIMAKILGGQLES